MTAQPKPRTTEAAQSAANAIADLCGAGGNTKSVALRLANLVAVALDEQHAAWQVPVAAVGAETRLVGLALAMRGSTERERAPIVEQFEAQCDLVLRERLAVSRALAPVAAPPAQDAHPVMTSSPSEQSTHGQYECPRCGWPFVHTHPDCPGCGAQTFGAPNIVTLCPECLAAPPAQPAAVEAPNSVEETIASRYAAGEDIPGLRDDYSLKHDAVHAAIRKTLGYLLDREARLPEAAEPAVPVAGESSAITRLRDFIEDGGDVEKARRSLRIVLRERDSALSQVETLRAELAESDLTKQSLLETAAEVSTQRDTARAQVETLQAGKREAERVAAAIKVELFERTTQRDGFEADWFTAGESLKVFKRERDEAKEQVGALIKERDNWKFDAEYNVKLTELREAKRMYQEADEECQVQRWSKDGPLDDAETSLLLFELFKEGLMDFANPDRVDGAPPSVATGEPALADAIKQFQVEAPNAFADLDESLALMGRKMPERAIVVGSTWLETERGLESHVTRLSDELGVRVERVSNGRLTGCWFGLSVFRRLFRWISDPPATPTPLTESGNEMLDGGDADGEAKS